MNFFTVYWLGGKKDFLYGADIADAYNKAGFGAATLKVTDHYQRGFDFRYKWEPTTKNWVINEMPGRVVNLYDIVVTGEKFDKQVTEGFLLPTFKEAGIWSHLQTDGQRLVYVMDLEKIFRLKFE